MQSFWSLLNLYASALPAVADTVAQIPGADPVMGLLGQWGPVGAVLYVFWRALPKILSVYRDVSLERAKLEMERLKFQHEQQRELAKAIECLSDRVHENTQASVQLATRIEAFMGKSESEPDAPRVVRQG